MIVASTTFVKINMPMQAKTKTRVIDLTLKFGKKVSRLISKETIRILKIVYSLEHQHRRLHAIDKDLTILILINE